MPAITFTATAHAINGQTVLRLPAEASAQLPSRGQVMVQGSADGQPLLVPAEPDGVGGHWLSFDRLVAEQPLTLSIEPVKNWPEPIIPADVQAGLAADPVATATWVSVTPMARWEWLRWINSTAQPETRKRRIEVSCSKLANGSRRPCCFNRSMCCVPEVSKNGVLLGA